MITCYSNSITAINSKLIDILRHYDFIVLNNPVEPNNAYIEDNTIILFVNGMKYQLILKRYKKLNWMERRKRFTREVIE